MLELLGLLGFISLGSYPNWVDFRHVPLAATALAVLAVIVSRIAPLNFRQILVVAIVSALLFVLGDALFSLFFPGLAKDIDMISIASLLLRATILFYLSLLHLLTMVVCGYVYKYVKRRGMRT